MRLQNANYEMLYRKMPQIGRILSTEENNSSEGRIIYQEITVKVNTENEPQIYSPENLFIYTSV